MSISNLIDRMSDSNGVEGDYQSRSEAIYALEQKGFKRLSSIKDVYENLEAGKKVYKGWTEEHKGKLFYFVKGIEKAEEIQWDNAIDYFAKQDEGPKIVEL